MEEDISNKTIVVLVVLTVLISVLSTLVVLNEVMGLKEDSFARQQPAGQPSNVAQGKISLEIKEPPVSTSSTGLVSFQIEDI